MARTPQNPPREPRQAAEGREAAADREQDLKIARRYEGGHGAPFSPVTPESADPDAPALDEIKSRDVQDGKTDARRSRREGTTDNAGPPEPEHSPAGETGRAPSHANALPAGKRQRRSHRTLN